MVDPCDAQAYIDWLTSAWCPFISQFDPSIILAVDSRLAMVEGEVVGDGADVLDQWCVENKIEFVAPAGPKNSVKDGQSFLRELHGGARVMEALQAHMWPNLVMKDNVETSVPISGSAGDETKGMADNNAVSPSEPSGIGQIAGGGEDVTGLGEADLTSRLMAQLEACCLSDDQNRASASDEESKTEMAFEELFATIGSLKQQASGLSNDERKDFAEKVAMSLFEGMGLDE